MLEKQAEDFRKMRSGDMKAFERLFVSLYPGLCNILTSSTCHPKIIFK